MMGEILGVLTLAALFALFGWIGLRQSPRRPSCFDCAHEPGDPGCAACGLAHDTTESSHG
jgi:hypothetical protein